MTRWILCVPCARKWRAQYPSLLPVRSGDEGRRYSGTLYAASHTGPAERGTMRFGTARHEMVCDHCNDPLPKDARAWAVGIIVDGLPVAAIGWEWEFINRPEL